MIALVAVLTTQRPGGVSYLEATLRDLDSAGANLLDRKTVISDGFVPALTMSALHERHRDWAVYDTAERQGIRQGLWRAIYLAVATGVDRLLFFEDDVRPCDNAVFRMLEVDIPEDCGMVSFADLKEVPEGSAPGLYVRPASGTNHSGFWSSLALGISGEICRELARQDFIRLGPEDPLMNGDRALGAALERTSRPNFAVHVPSLVDHVGDVSVHQAPDAIRRMRNYPGEGFDALILPVPEVFR